MNALQLQNATSIQKPEIAPLTKRDILTEIFKETVVDIALTAGFTAAAIPFITTGLSYFIIAGAAGVIASLAVRVFTAMFRYYEDPKAETVFYKGLSNGSPALIGLFSYTPTLDTVIHEAGHAAAAKTLLSKVTYKITITPLQGLTQYSWQGLSLLGEKIGLLSSKIVITAAGTAATTLTAFSAIALGYCIKEKSERAYRYLTVIPLASIPIAASYAITTLSSSSSSSDFAVLAKYGVHPLVSLSFLALPLLLKSALLWKDSFNFKNLRQPYSTR